MYASILRRVFGADKMTEDQAGCIVGYFFNVKPSANFEKMH